MQQPKKIPLSRSEFVCRTLIFQWTDLRLLRKCYNPPNVQFIEHHSFCKEHKQIKGVVHPKKKMKPYYWMNYSSSSHPKPLRPPFIFKTQIKTREISVLPFKVLSTKTLILHKVQEIVKAILGLGDISKKCFTILCFISVSIGNY